MKTLILMRHAEAVNDYREVDDFHRPLTNYGIKQANQCAAEFAKTGVKPELILVSNAVRTTQTATILTAAIPHINTQFNTQFLPNLYLCKATELLQIISETDNNISCLMVIAHNPSLHELSYDLTNDELLNHGFPTATIAIFAWNSDDWQNYALHDNNILHFIEAKPV